MGFAGMGGFIAQLAKQQVAEKLTVPKLVNEVHRTFSLFFNSVSLWLTFSRFNELLPQDTGMDLAFSPPALGRRTVSTPFL